MVFSLTPVEGSDFVNRKELLSEIVTTLSNPRLRMGFALYGTRRMGKTSIFRETARQLALTRQIVPVYFSMWQLVENTLEEFTQKLTIAILDAYKERFGLQFKAKNLMDVSLSMLKDILKNLSISLKLREDLEVILSLTGKENKDAGSMVENVFLLAEQAALETKTRCVLFLDEFPFIMEIKKNNIQIGEGVLKCIRSCYEKQPHTILCICGSIRKTMEITALHPAAAFYQQFIIKEIGPLEKPHVKELLSHNFGKHISEEIMEKVYAFSGGIPFYIQALGRQLQGHIIVTPALVDKAIESYLQEEGDILFREQFFNLSGKERKIIAVMARQKLFTLSEIAMAAKESPTTIHKYLSNLEEKGVVKKVGKGEYQFQDCVFKQWLELQD